MDLQGFESRKQDHIRIALSSECEATGYNGLDRVKLLHNPIPELDFSKIDLQSQFWDYRAASPCFISSMTAGHSDGENLNYVLATVASEKRWPMGVGSQRRELKDPEAQKEWQRLRKSAPKAFFIGNLGLAQLISTPTAKLLQLAENLEAQAFFIHTNPMQECLQPEGTTNFAGGLQALEQLCQESPIPILLKETGCGFSEASLRRLQNIGLAAIDVSGFGGTHWGRVEGQRSATNSLQANAAKTFAHWGESTYDSLMACRKISQAGNASFATWASGGIRNGLEVAKCLALGAEKVGFAKPALHAALEGERSLAKWMDLIEYELKIALFCTGNKDPKAFSEGVSWQKI